MLYSENVAYLEDIVRRYLADPSTVEPTLRAWLEGPGREYLDAVAPPAGPSHHPGSVFARPPKSGGNGHAVVAREAAPGPDVDILKAQARISQLVNAFRVRGHLQASLDPLGFAPIIRHPELDPAYWGLGPQHQDKVFSTAPLYGPPTMTLRELHAWLLDTYSRTIGCEFMYIHDVEIKQWCQARFEKTRNRSTFDRDTQIFLYDQLLRAEAFEDFIHHKFRGAKRFSLEGAESLMPLLALVIESSARQGVKEICLGMAHRGRLNVLANVFGKDPAKIFAEFADTNPEDMLGRGDVKYHMGYDSTARTRFGDEVQLALAFNPSHLEAINPVVEGKVRATQDRMGPGSQRAVLPILIHGDAAFAGQGLVAETLNMCGLDGYSTGGTIHVVVNNQIGFTTEPKDARSAHYCTEIAKMIQAPIFHVNGEDPEAVAHVAHIAAEFRQTFARDVVIDMYCYRKYGHNEGDEPSFTQPLMYRAIAQHPPAHVNYRRHLVANGTVTDAELDAIDARFRGTLEQHLEVAKTTKKTFAEPYRGRWAPYKGGPDASVPAGMDTSISDALYERVIRALTTTPEGFAVNPKVQKILERRLEALDPSVPIDWGLGEMLAYGSLVAEGAAVRISGQDVTRGTFSHRHAGLFDLNTNQRFVPLQALAAEVPGARFDVYNSLLSEAAVLGFEYGYALEDPNALVVWEAQFGDFVNGAQVIVDQFISAGEDKWNRLSAVTLLLPHGFEGQGPEHSSARLERFLQLSAEDNMQVCNLTTPAQIFHALRRQLVRPWRKPLVVMSPKSLLRHKLAVSHRADFTSGYFRRVIGEQRLPTLANVERAIVCSGKVYFDLLERRDAAGDHRTAIIRLEQLYPFPETQLLAALAELPPPLKEIVWVQEEPSNMGAFRFLHPIFTRLHKSGAFGSAHVRYEARPESASPATGSPKAHAIEQHDLLERAFT
ncbi:MAG: 2-oxoglutarate dehydrogenase E1 component [Deltaproteobacteria bacterium]|nr:2-oxoglutarate dehydrogenase E1 component [Deltaproteobacteria bacterium]